MDFRMKVFIPVIATLAYSYYCSEQVLQNCQNPGLKIGRQWA